MSGGVPRPSGADRPGTNRLGRTDTEVTGLGFGAAGIGNLFAPLTDEQATEAVTAAWDKGIRYFDTAPHYGLGLSERRLGLALRDRPRAEFTISTKVGRLLEPAEATGDDLADGFAVPGSHRRVWDFSADGVRRSLESSLERLSLDHVDVVYLHDPDDHADQAFHEGYPALEKLRSEGVVGAIGAGMNQTAMLTRFVRETDVDVVLCAGRYTLLDRSALTDLLPAAEERGVSVVIGGAFNSGLLADPKPGATYNYTAAPQELLDEALRLKAVADRHGITLRAAALAFCAAHPAVASVLVGARSAAEVVDGADQFAAPVPDAFWKEAGL
ncbi:aldo/keto reductase [Streptomyces acidiscabies]|uniref:Aldo/keto reductase n=1 Tax=Streptomyces acidiscabies TaxID=42234 RepID=A0AAP6ELE8_9ACTN|nr:aldo/keto reductase [Streptomyces acidiscabies]MBZ3912560.1 aldo/keto reductase [Streptomyces acidiscabies]MDX2966978.1 aldo/keto reductase [Streptomyces acidiscabies]MDX3025929.1 aldo/keto reductase [Streptomyces acidiscabies]MDX3796899.1 aldo/keto reductase [Streptomyces acidiscabies]GAV45367.1 D-threo-aldose 1-dehydrogenase [Streptomyces acidiscabies]